MDLDCICGILYAFLLACLKELWHIYLCIAVITPPSVDKDSKDQKPEDVEGKLKETQEQIEEYKCKILSSQCSVVFNFVDCQWHLTFNFVLTLMIFL